VREQTIALAAPDSANSFFYRMKFNVMKHAPMKRTDCWQSGSRDAPYLCRLCVSLFGVSLFGVSVIGVFVLGLSLACSTAGDAKARDGASPDLSSTSTGGSGATSGGGGSAAAGAGLAGNGGGHAGFAGTAGGDSHGTGGHSGGQAGSTISAGGGTGPGGMAGMGASSGGGATAAGGSCAALGTGPLASSSQHRDIGVHDPSLIWDGQGYVLLATGGNLGLRTSTNVQQWTSAGDIFSATPAWLTSTLGLKPVDLWAPDISYFNCQFHVYYAGSSFGSNNSVIGLATSPTLDRGSASYKWSDQGLVVRSQDSDDYNAIDPNVAFDDSGNPWLTFGSFWSGIKLRRLDPTTGKPSTADTMLYSLASRDGGAIEAPSLVAHNGFYYLFVSFDACCRDVSSTYRTMVGRATKITGPYTNKAGASMMQGAAEQLLATSGRYIGPGGGTAMKMGDTYLYVFHYYDRDDKGAPKLQVRPFTFDAGDWPVLGEALFP